MIPGRSGAVLALPEALWGNDEAGAFAKALDAVGQLPHLPFNAADVSPFSAPAVEVDEERLRGFGGLAHAEEEVFRIEGGGFSLKGWVEALDGGPDGLGEAAKERKEQQEGEYLSFHMEASTQKNPYFGAWGNAFKHSLGGSLK